ncbi:hypothetical protein DL240_18040 [Lujinxingia litoralis]|uniref:Uncharacterized protein n=1 Tax=Lujinxingia litoralis TaxID=2211119 RepID=A0A328C5I8_9DELT|nr:GldG family protein [Lujinxingia litoralis]RAL20280.1 hypothetical protein DL240_18040 [Lujinxingia litoralis]
MSQTNTHSGARRRLISRAHTLVMGVLLVAIAVAANAAMSQVFWRLDLTENQIYTLSEPSRAAVRELEEPVEVHAFISPDLPAPFHSLSQDVADLLSEYQAASGGKLTFKIIAPEESPEQEEAAAGFGIEQVAIGQQSESEVSLRAIYKGVAFIQGEQSEVIRDLQVTGQVGLDNFEYEFTRALLNLRRPEPRRIAFASGAGGPVAQPDFVQSLEQVFSQLYGNLIEATTYDLSQAEPIPDDVHALVLLNVDASVSEEALFAIDQFLQRGGSVGWFQSATVIDEAMQRQLMEQIQQMPELASRLPTMRKRLDSNLIDLFGHYGITYRADTVIDRDRALSFSLVATPQGLARVSHPGSFSITDIDPELPFVRDFSTMALPVPSSLSIDEALRGRDTLEFHEVLRTSAGSTRLPSPPADMSYQTFVEPAPEEEPGPFVVAATVQGMLPSYYSEHPLPAGKSEAELEREPQPGRLLVVGSGDFMGPQRETGFDERLAGLGAQFFLNSVEWLVQDSALSQIRGKSLPRLIGEVSPEQKRAIQFANIVMVPSFFALLGVMMMSRRRRRREALSQWTQTPGSRK